MESGQAVPEHRHGGLGHGLALALRIAALVIVFATPTSWPQQAPPQKMRGTDPWRVVIIRSWDSQFPINVVRERALVAALVEDAPRVVEVYAEELDLLRFPEGWDLDLADLLKQKYRAMHVDAVIASGREPLDFAVHHRDEIWPRAPIVFNGVIDGTLEDWKRTPGTTGVTMAFDVKGTLAIGLALAPKARSVYFVAGTGDFETSYLEYSERELRRSGLPLEGRRIVGLSLEETFARVASVERDSLVFYLTVLRDRKGQFQPPNSDVVTRIAESSPVPVLSAVSTQFNRGAVGGSSAQLDRHGRAAGLLARRVLEGEDPNSIPVRADPAPECQLDWDALQRWHVPERNVPPRCAVIGRSSTLMEAYFWPFVLLAAVAAGEGALIWALVVQSRRRKQAEAETAERQAQLAHVGRVSMMGALTASIAHEINQPMGAILSNTDAAEMMLDQGTLDVSKLREILADIRSEDMRASEVIRGLRRMLARHEVQTVPLSVNIEVAEALRHLSYDAARREARLEPLFDPEIPSILGDSVQLQQVIVNLVMNAMEAVRESPQNEREIRVVTRAQAHGAEIAVKDRGPGIAPGDVVKLFESFHTTKKDGMGLGLAIVRTIVEMHGGHLTYEHNVPHGAIFRVWLPATGT